MLLDKTENDDKLVVMLKQEVARLESIKGVKSQLRTTEDTAQLGEFTKQKKEMATLQNQVKCQQIEIEQKDEKIQNLMTSCIGAPDERYEEKEVLIAELEEKCENLKRELTKTKQEMRETGTKAFPKKSRDEQERII